jgi:phosphoribosylformimino-5-aminoimidazole carboxamide ribotide isomerase
VIVFPAVDIQNGKTVRLKQGRAAESTVYASDPLATARSWQERGARWLHVVDLDGAFDGKPKNYQLISRICKALSIPVQLGGGIRNPETANAYLDAGVTRLIIGTMALEEPELFASLCQVHPGKIGVSLDAVDGQLKSRGWLADTGQELATVLPRLLEAGAAFIIYTDISRDGMQSGINLPALEALAKASSVPVIAAGGVASLQDIQLLYPLTRKTNLVGAISGKALYEGSLRLEEANAWIAAQE